MAFQKYTFKSHSLFRIAYISGGIASIADLWKTEAQPYMHALQFMISLGGIVTPFIIQPFLAVSYPSVTNVTQRQWERSGSVVECFTRDRRVAGSSLTGVTALWSLSKTHLS